MKRLPLLFLSLFILCAACKNDKDLSGMLTNQKYSGTLPCADCPGIETSVKFITGNKFEKSVLYLESEVPQKFMKGKFTLNKENKIIRLLFSEGREEFYRIKSDSTIVLLNADKEEIKGEWPKLLY